MVKIRGVVVDLEILLNDSRAQEVVNIGVGVEDEPDPSQVLEIALNRPTIGQTSFLELSGKRAGGLRAGLYLLRRWEFGVGVEDMLDDAPQGLSKRVVLCTSRRYVVVVVHSLESPRCSG